jgi:hypothetical protein
MNSTKTRFASTAVAFVFGSAAVGGTALTIAAPANAAPGPSDTTTAPTPPPNLFDDQFGHIGIVQNPNFMPSDPARPGP